MRLLLACAIALAIVTPARLHAQVRTVRSVALEGAQRALAAASAEARKQGWAVSIAVVDPAGELVAFLRLDGAPPSRVDVSGRGDVRACGHAGGCS